MIDLSMEYAKEMGLNPYYMYRQKHMLGNLENIGYAKEGYECIYNMQIMEEKQSNYAQALYLNLYMLMKIELKELKT